MKIEIPTLKDKFKHSKWCLCVTVNFVKKRRDKVSVCQTVLQILGEGWECEWAEKRNSFRRRQLLAGTCQASERPVRMAVWISLYLSGVFSGTNSFIPLVKNWHRCVCSLWLYCLECLLLSSKVLPLAKPIFWHWALPLRPAVKSLFTHSFISVVWTSSVLGDFTLYWGHFLLCMWLFLESNLSESRDHICSYYPHQQEEEA